MGVRVPLGAPKDYRGFVLVYTLKQVYKRDEKFIRIERASPHFYFTNKVYIL